ncbi:pentapeptide repeat-containing protein [Streptomyces chartreusis]|uniref:pentapeptide repeat-containing protein n=1 Tax=Streptomyces chartreusis TaxID=1969 RepID=UPI0036CD32F8
MRWAVPLLSRTKGRVGRVPGGTAVIVRLLGGPFAGRVLETAGADLRGATRMDVTLNEATLSGADLSGVDLSTARGLTHEQVRLARTDQRTLLPPNLRDFKGQ